MTSIVCTCGAMASDYADPSTNDDDHCPCEAVFKVAAVLRYVEGLSLRAGVVAPAISEGAVAATGEVIANYRER